MCRVPNTVSNLAPVAQRFGAFVWNKIARSTLSLCYSGTDFRRGSPVSLKASARDWGLLLFEVSNFGQIASKCGAIFKLGRGGIRRDKTYAHVVSTYYPD
jgi:hypothetical protein